MLRLFFIVIFSWCLSFSSCSYLSACLFMFFNNWSVIWKTNFINQGNSLLIRLSAYSCLREELYNDETGDLICRVEARYGTGVEALNEVTVFTSLAQLSVCLVWLMRTYNYFSFGLISRALFFSGRLHRFTTVYVGLSARFIFVVRRSISI